VVRRGERGGEEFGDVRDDRLCFLLIQRGDGLQRQLGGDFAFGVAAHAVRQDEQAGFPRVAITHAVFVFFAPALAADLENGEFHG